MKDYGTLKNELKELRYLLIISKDDNEIKGIKKRIEQVKKEIMAGMRKEKTK